MQMSTAVLGSVEEVTPDWLTDVLRRQEALAGIRVTKVRVDEAKQSFMASIAKLRIGYDGDPPVGSPTRLFLKTSRPPDQPASSASGRGEIAFYRTGAPAMADPPVPRCYDAAFEDATQRFHLLLEDLSESHRELSDYPLPPTIVESEGIVTAFARVHAAMWGDPRIGNGIGPGLPDPDLYVTHLGPLFARFADALGDRLSSERRQRCERMLAARPLITKRFSVPKDLTLIHGDAHVGNMLYPREESSGGVRLVDWDFWRIRPAAWDLAFMMAVHWFPDRRHAAEDRLLQHYHRALEAEGVQAYDIEALRRDYRLAVIDQLMVPLHQMSVKQDAAIWWTNFERIMHAYEDLGCEELLG